MSMDSPTSSPTSDGLLADKIGGFGYGIGVSVGILLLITTITLTSYFCTRNSSSSPPPSNDSQPQRQPPDLPPRDQQLSGIDEATLLSYPKLLYSQAKRVMMLNKWSCCSICLAEYKGRDLLRVLPDCAHVFHVKCVDPWLRIHPTCPLCRTSPLPTPLSTPLAEVAPLTHARPPDRRGH